MTACALVFGVVFLTFHRVLFAVKKEKNIEFFWPGQLELIDLPYVSLDMLSRLRTTCPRLRCPPPIPNALKRSSRVSSSYGLWLMAAFLRGNGVVHRTRKVIQVDDNGHVGRPCEVSLAPPYPEPFASYGASVPPSELSSIARYRSMIEPPGYPPAGPAQRPGSAHGNGKGKSVTRSLQLEAPGNADSTQRKCKSLEVSTVTYVGLSEGAGTDMPRRLRSVTCAGAWRQARAARCRR